ncbi:MAG: hypothetical protein C4539_19325 [Ignavibacteriales bacterium]|nr:MAG: hypothetical protein C4539_19325 [Ignavibacteriales bacterium]
MIKKSRSVNVLKTLQQIFAGEISRSELNKFIEFSCRIAHHYVLAEKNKLVYRLKDDFVDTFDIAVRAISPIFLVNSLGEFSSLKKSFYNWTPKIESENDASFFLNKIIQKKTKQLLGDIYKESNPFFNKTLDSVYYYISLYKLQKMTHRGQTYIVKKGFNKTNGKMIPDEEFQSIPFSYFTEDKKMFVEIYKLLGKKNYQPAIPIYQLTWRLVEIKSEYFKQPTDENASFISKQVVDEILDLGLQNTIRKLEESYLKKEKISGKEFRIYSLALKDISDDLKFSGTKRMLFEYLKPYYKNLTVSKFNEKYRNTFEYLDKLYRKEMAKLYKA